MDADGIPPAPPPLPEAPGTTGAQATPVAPVLEATLQVSSAAGRFLKDAPGSVPASQQVPTEGLLSGHGAHPEQTVSPPRAPVPQGGTAAPCVSGSTHSCPRSRTGMARPTRHRASRWGRVWTCGKEGSGR